MRCIVPGANIKVFGRAVHSLSKIGEELYVEPLDHGLALRTVNSTRSAYACFLFAPSFFQFYDDGSDQISSQDSDDGLRCKIGMASVMTVFKYLSHMEKTVDQCKIKLNMKESRLIFQLHCRHGIVKTHNLYIIECETLQAVFSKDMCVNSLTASSKLLCDAVHNFQNNVEEITLTVNPEKISLNNYVDDEPDPNKVMHTNLTLDPDEFDNCQIGVDTDVTFCLKELRAILAFAEVTTLPLTLHFETAGRPIVYSIDSDNTFEANFVLATRAEPSGLTQSSTQPRMSTQKKQIQRSVSKPYKPRPSTSGSKSSNMSHNTTDYVSVSRKGDQSEGSKRSEGAHQELMEDDAEFDDMIIEHNTTININKNDKSTKDSNNIGKITNANNNVVNERRDGSKPGGLASTPARDKIDNPVIGNGDNESQVPSSSTGDSESPFIPVLGTKARLLLDTTVTEDIDMADGSGEDELDDTIPGTPPAKRFKSLFFGMSQSQQSQTKTSHNISVSKVLAADTDDED